MTSSPPTQPQQRGVLDVVLVGGGHTNSQVVQNIPASLVADKGVRLTLVSEFDVSYYSGMLPGCVSGLYTEKDIYVNLPALCSANGWQFVKRRMSGLDAAAQLLHLEDGGEPIHYDLLAVGIGSVSKGMHEIPGVTQFAMATRPISRLFEQIRRFDALHPSWDRPPRVVIVGAGAAGYELSLGFQARLLKNSASVDVTIVDSHGGPDKPVVLPSAPTCVTTQALEVLREKGIRLVSGRRVARVEETQAFLDDGTSLPFDLLVFASGAAAPSCVSNSLGAQKLAVDNGFILVNDKLQSVSHPNVFGAGDCISIQGFAPGFPPKAGVYAVREGPILTDNILAFIDSKPLKSFVPQTGFLSLLMTADGCALGHKFDIAFKGAWVWAFKDWIDRSWMERFSAGAVSRDFHPSKQAPEEPSDTALAAVALQDCSKTTTEFGVQWRVLTRMAADADYCQAVVAEVRRLESLKNS